MTGVKLKDEKPKAGGVLHVDLTRAQSRIAHAMMLIEHDHEAIRMLSSAYNDLDKLIDRLFDGKRAAVGN